MIQNYFDKYFLFTTGFEGMKRKIFNIKSVVPDLL